MKKSIRDMKKTDEYYQITTILRKEVFDRVKKLLESDEEAKKLTEIIENNNKTYFNKYNEDEFQTDYGFTDDYGEDYMDWRFDSRLYDQYKRYTTDFEGVIAELEAEKAKLQKGFHFGKKAKLERLDARIKNAHETHQRYMKIYEREKTFKQTWQKDGKFFDINEEHVKRLRDICIPYIEKAVAECIDKHPELMVYSFDGFSVPGTNSMFPVLNKHEGGEKIIDNLRYRVSSIIEKELASRTLKTVKTSEEPQNPKKTEEEPSEMGSY